MRRVALLAVALSASCRVLDDFNTVCTADFRYGIHVTVRDSVTADFIASGAELIARDGAYADSMSFPANDAIRDEWPLLGAGERAGVYTVTVRKPGYGNWVKSGVQVTADECHVRPTRLTALLLTVP